MCSAAVVSVCTLVPNHIYLGSLGLCGFRCVACVGGERASTARVGCGVVVPCALLGLLVALCTSGVRDLCNPRAARGACAPFALCAERETRGVAER